MRMHKGSLNNWLCTRLGNSLDISKHASIESYLYEEKKIYEKCFSYASQFYRRKSRVSVSFFFQSIELLIHKSYIFMYIFVNWKIFDYVYTRTMLSTVYMEYRRTHSTDILVVAQWLTNCVYGIENVERATENLAFRFSGKNILLLFLQFFFLWLYFGLYLCWRMI